MLHQDPAMRAAVVASGAFFVLVLAFAFIRSGDVPSQQAVGQEDTGQEAPEGHKSFVRRADNAA